MEFYLLWEQTSFVSNQDMKTLVIISAFILFAGRLRTQAQSAALKFSGHTSVEGLGSFTFPPGEWTLEFQRIHHAATQNKGQADYTVFKKLGNKEERLTFLQFPASSPAQQLQHYLDTVGETLGDGIPQEQKMENRKNEPKKQSANSDSGKIHMMNTNPMNLTETTRTIYYSFIHVPPSPEPAWLCHTVLFLHEDAVFIIALASTSSTDPDIVDDVQSSLRIAAKTVPSSKEK